MIQNVLPADLGCLNYAGRVREIICIYEPSNNAHPMNKPVH